MAKRKEKAERIERVKNAHIPDGAAYVTGQTIHVNGGMAMI